jgi:hypothetical protein
MLSSDEVFYHFVGIVDLLEFGLGFFDGESCGVCFVWMVLSTELPIFHFCLSFVHRWS